MFFYFDNQNVNIGKPDHPEPKKRYGGYKYDKKFVVPKYRRSDKGRILPLKKEEDALQQLLETAKKGDTVVTRTAVNFSKKTEGIFSVLDKFLENGVRVVILNEDFDSKMMDGATYNALSRIASNASKEQQNAQIQGIKIAREDGRYSPRLSVSDFERFPQLVEKLLNDDITKAEFAKELGISRPTLDKLLREYKDTL